MIHPGPTAGLWSLLAFGLAACAGKGTEFDDRPCEPSATGPVSFSQNVQPVLTQACALSGCHGGEPLQPAGKPMNLREGQAYANLVCVRSDQVPRLFRAEPGLPDSSYIVHKLEWTQAEVGGSGERMPLGRAPLPQFPIDVIRDWIASGAPNN